MSRADIKLPSSLPDKLNDYLLKEEGGQDFQALLLEINKLQNPIEAKRTLFNLFRDLAERTQGPSIKIATNFIKCVSLLSSQPGFDFTQDEAFNAALAPVISKDSHRIELKAALKKEGVGLVINFEEINPSIPSSKNSSPRGSSESLNFLGHKTSPQTPRKHLEVPLSAAAKPETPSADGRKTKNRDDLHLLLEAYSSIDPLAKTSNFSGDSTLYSFWLDQKKMTLLVSNIAESPAKQFNYELQMGVPSVPEAIYSDKETGKILQNLLTEVLEVALKKAKSLKDNPENPHIKRVENAVLIEPLNKDLEPCSAIRIGEKGGRYVMAIVQEDSSEQYSPPTVELVIQLLQNITGEQMIFPTMGTSEEVSRSAPVTPETQRTDFRRDLERALGSPPTSPSATRETAQLAAAAQAKHPQTR